MTCAAPTPFETLVALWSGDLSTEAAESVEAHLFSCDACAEASERLGRLIVGLRELIPPVISHAHLDRLAASGKRVRRNPVQSGIDIDAHFTTDTDLLIHVLKADLSRADRVDLEIFDEQGAPFLRLEHVPFDRSSGEVLIACQRHYQHMEGMSSDPVFHMHVVEAGVTRPVGRYFVRHHWD